jgi:hypothetical protein
MPTRDEPFTADDGVCRLVSFQGALRTFATSIEKTQSQRHIKPLHWYVACRLVIEGGFDPDSIVPRPPFIVDRRSGRRTLIYDPSRAEKDELSVLGGLKTKSVDVAVVLHGIGPVLTVSCKGMTKALRNLTNRLEEAVGDCTNLHITYPAMVCAYLMLFRVNRQSDPSVAPNDVSVEADLRPTAAVRRFELAMRNLAGRRSIRNDVSRYEAVSVGLVDAREPEASSLLAGFPDPGSPLSFGGFFDTIYQRYDERFVFGAPELGRRTLRLGWADESPALLDSAVRVAIEGFSARTADANADV